MPGLLEQGSSAFRQSYDIIFRGVEVPNWFQEQSTGSCLSFVVPPLVNQKILGLILCSVISMLHKEEDDFWYSLSYDL